MTDKLTNKRSAPGRVLFFSHRNIYEREVWRCSFNEFEGIVQQMDSVELLAPKPTKWHDQLKKNAMRLGKYSTITINPGIPKIKLEREYDLFFAVCEKPSELLNINAVENWGDSCKTSICWLVEFWVKDMPLYKSALKVLSKFDYVVCMFDMIDPFRKAITSQCSYLPAGIDTMLFSPYPDPPERSIDVFSIGRRSVATHQELLRLARENKIFYVYDTLDDLHAYSLEEHRFMMANMAKRSKYFMVNPGKINSPGETGGQSEFGYRYFEGAAPGTIMVGEYPNNAQFEKIFTWPDAVIHLPFGSTNIGEIIRELNGQPERQEKIRKNNIVQSLLHHDWAYRWEAILKIAGLEPESGLVKRKKRLKSLAKLI